MIDAVYGRHFHVGIAPLGPADDAWFDIWPTESGAPWVRAQRIRNGYRIRYENRADFAVDLETHRITAEPRDCPDETLRHFVLDQIVPLMLSVDRVVLHASSVAVHDAYAAFVGPGGAGKSTLALALARAGFAIGSDDGLLVESGSCPGVPRPESVRSPRLAVPSYPSLRVWEDSASLAPWRASNAGRSPLDKRQFRDGVRFRTDALPLTCLYVLNPEPAPAVRFEGIAPRDLTMTLVEQSYRLALDDRAALAAQFDALAAIARATPAWRLSSPRRLDGWRDLAAAVADHAGGAARFEVA